MPGGGLLQRATAIEIAVVIVVDAPVLGGLGEPAMDEVAFTVVVEPVAKRLPFTDQGFVGDFNGNFTSGIDGIGNERKQPHIGSSKFFDDGSDNETVTEFIERDAATSVFAPFA